MWSDQTFEEVQEHLFIDIRKGPKIIPRFGFAKLTLLLICSRNFSLLSTITPRSRSDLTCSIAILPSFVVISYLKSVSRFPMCRW